MFELKVFEIVNILAVVIGVIFGFVSQQKQFCFSGSIKDYIHTKSTKRAASVVMAMIVAIISTTIIANYFDLDLSQSNYYKSNINYFAIIAGGVMFGVGMMIADGCSSRSLVKFAQGDSNALITLVFMAIFAFAATRGILYGVFDPFINNETLINISSYIDNFKVNIYLALTILFIFLAILTKKIKRVFSLIDGFIIGLLISFAWFVTGYIGAESFERSIELSSISFVYPSAKSLEFVTFYNLTELSFGVCLIFGVLIGTYISTVFNKKYSFGCTVNKSIKKVKNNIIGGALMGIGGVMAIGCTVGQGLSGLSTLAFSSFLAIASIFISGFITGKILHKKNKLAMCFVFDWEDEKKETPINYQI